MSLIGSLDDLGLGDILQIINLSQKSGVLIVNGDRGEGRILFRDGLVRGAAQKGRPHTLRDLLVAANLIAADSYDEVVTPDDGDPQQVLIERDLLAEEQIIAVCREAVESAVVEMFSWQSGEFSFDVRSEGEPGDPELLLAVGVNAQYLAMEGVRLQDEMSQSDRGEERFASSDAEGARGGQAAALDLLAERAVEGVTGEDEADELDELDAGDVWHTDAAAAIDSMPLIDVEPVPHAHDCSDGEEHDASDPLTLAERETAHLGAESDAEFVDDLDEAELAAAAARPALVVIDPELRVLEWTKRVLKDEFPRVHIFQQSDLGLLRIRQYLSRAELPLVLISPETVGEPAAGIDDVRDFVARLKRQAPQMAVLWLCETPPASTGDADGCVSRPGLDLLRDARAANERDGLAEAMRRELRDALSRSRGDVPQTSMQPDAASDAALQRLRRATEDLNEASVRGEILPRVIEFARESFSRVAMFMVREGRVTGMAESGLHRGGGPDADAFREVDLAISDSAWFQSVIEGRGSIRTATDELEASLCGLFCGAHAEQPLEAYLAPIESSGQVVALLYADHLPEQREIGDTSSLEVVLSHAGLALDRAVLERALGDVHGDDDAAGSASNPASSDPLD